VPGGWEYGQAASSLRAAAAMAEPRIFLLSPAFCGGKRAQMVMRDAAAFPLAVRLREGGVALGEVFAFLSGLYFRGKLAYAGAFAAPPQGVDGALVITPTRGLVAPSTRVTLDDLREFAGGEVDAADPRFRAPLARDARALAEAAGPAAGVVLLGSIASGKYVDVLAGALGERLLFPVDFVGRGDMSRGGLMLRAADSGQELPYAPVAGAVRRGPRPPRLAPRR
jgi:hypothetical protein